MCAGGTVDGQDNALFQRTADSALAWTMDQTIISGQRVLTMLDQLEYCTIQYCRQYRPVSIGISCVLSLCLCVPTSLLIL